jgi:hypothetical protein
VSDDSVSDIQAQITLTNFNLNRKRDIAEVNIIEVTKFVSLSIILQNRDIVAAVGPVSMVTCVEESFWNYESGVYYQPNCCTDIQHAMLIVGYGTDPVGGDYW